MLQKFQVSGNDGKRHNLIGLKTVVFDGNETSTDRRNDLLGLIDGISTIEKASIFEVTDKGESLVCVLTPVDFDALSGQWSIAWGEGVQPKRDFDGSRCSTFVKKYTETDEVDKDGKKVKTSENVRIDLRVDLQEAFYEALRALKGETTEKTSTPRETKAVLKTALDAKTSENDGLRKILVTLAKKNKINVTEDMTIDQINEAIAKGK